MLRGNKARFIGAAAVLLVVVLVASFFFLRPAAPAVSSDLVSRGLSQMDHRQFDVLDRTADTLLRRATATGDDRLESYALVFKASAAFALHEKPLTETRISQQLSRAKELAGGLRNDTVLAMAYNLNAIYETETHNSYYYARSLFDKAHHHALQAGNDRLAAKVALNLANLGTRMNDTTCAPYAREAYLWSQKHEEPFFLFNAASLRAFYCSVSGREAGAIRYIEQADSIERACQIPNNSAYLNLQAEIYANIGQNARALQTLARLGVADSLPLPLQVDYYYNRAHIEQNRHDFTASNASLEQGMTAARRAPYGGDHARFLGMKAQNLEHLGDTLQALAVQKQLAHYNDSLRKLEKEWALGQIEQTLFEDDKGGYPDRNASDGFLSNSLLLAIAAVLVPTVLGGVVLGVRRLKKREFIGEEEPKRAVVNEEKGQKLFAQLEQLMREEYAYRQVELTRDTMAKQLGTNRTYLSQIVQSFAGTSFNQYVNAYRLTEATTILADPAQADVPVKAVCTAVGFRSRTTFDKLFQERTGLTPVEYRKQKLQ